MRKKSMIRRRSGTGMTLRLFPFFLMFFSLGVPARGLHAQEILSMRLIREVGTDSFENPDAVQEYRSKIEKGMLEEAARTFSGMIYGFRFFYRPAYRERNIAPAFDLVPLGSVDRKKLEIYQRRDRTFREVTSKKERPIQMEISVRYPLTAAEKGRLHSWSGMRFLTGRGTGAVAFSEKEARRKAVEDGMKNSIREVLRQRNYRRPKSIKGFIALQAPPFLFTDSGQYKSRVQTLFSVVSREEFDVY